MNWENGSWKVHVIGDREASTAEGICGSGVIDGVAGLLESGLLEDTGYLDHLFVRWDCQGQGIAAALCDALEAHCRELGVYAVTVHASKTALPFFLGRGYAIEREQQVPCRGQVLTNYVLEKIL